MRRRPYGSGREPTGGPDRKETVVSEPLPAEESTEVEMEIVQTKPLAPTFGDPRSLVLDDDWSDD